MRNLKRVLSLALAAMMLIGMMVVGAGAANLDFTDADEIKNTEAVEVMVALNVFNGVEDGSTFDPAGTLTREQMAKIIAYVMNGGVEPVLGVKETPTYSDIDGIWSEKYIEYATSMGIIAGDGTGKFNPKDTLTGEQAAKMLLTAMGYDATVFGFVGNSWSTNVNRYANEAGLYEDLGGLDPSQPISRDDACQLAYNAIQADVMKKTWTIDPATGEQSLHFGLEEGKNLLGDKFSGAIQVGYMTGYSYDSNKEIWTYTFSSDAKFGCAALTANNRIGSSKTLKTDVDYTGFYGQQVKVIYNTSVNDKVYGIYANDSQVLADGYTGNLPSSIAAADETIKFAGTEYKLKGAASGVQVYYNNGGSAVNQLNNLSNSYVPAGYELAAVRLIDNNSDNKVDVVVTTPLTELKVTYVGATTVTFETQGVKKYEDIVCYDGIAKDDRVLYTAGAYSNTGIPTYEKLTIETGTVTGVKGTSDVMVDDSWNVNVSGTTLAVGDTIEYVSLGGRIYYAEVVEYADTVNDVVMVITAGKTGTADVTIGGVEIEAKLLFSDNTKKTVTLSTIDGTPAKFVDSNSTDSSANDGDAGNVTKEIGKMFTYKVDNDGNYALTSIAAAEENKTDNLGSNFAGYDGTGTADGYNNGTIGGKNLADDAVVFIFDGTVGIAATTNNAKVYTGKEIKNTFGSDSDGDLGAGKPKVDPIDGTVASCLYSTDSNGFTYARVAALKSTNMIVTTGNNYGYLLADAYRNKNADNKNQLNLKYWDGTQEVTATWETETAPDGFKAGAAITFDTVSDSEIKNVSVVLTTDGQVNAYAGGKDLEINGVSKKITEDTVILYVDSEDTTYAPDGGDIAIGDGVHDNVRFLDGGNGLALLIVDVTNEIEAAPSYIVTTSAAAVDALRKTKQVTLNMATVSGSDAGTILDALKTSAAAGLTVTVTGNFTAPTSAKDLYGNLVVNGTYTTGANAVTVKDGATLKVGALAGTVAKLAADAGATINVVAPDATAMGILENAAVAKDGVTVVLGASATGTADEWYTSVGSGIVNGEANTGTAGETSTSVPAGTYVYGTNNVYKDNNGAKDSVWLLQK